MNSLERVKATFRRQQVDRLPFYPIVSGMAAKVTGITTAEYYGNLDRMADAQIGLHEEIGQDVVVMMSDLFMEVEAMGADLEFPEGEVPRLKSYLLKDKRALGSLAMPDPATSGRLPAYVDACRKAVGAIGDAPVGGVICGPWTLATNLRGAQELIMDTVEDPDFVHELMRFTSGVTRVFGEAVTGTRAGLSLSEAPASLSLISPKIFNEFVLPYLKEIVGHFKERKSGITLHICGFIDPIMDDIVSSGAIAISMDQPSSLDKMLSACGSKSVVIGNVSTGVFIDGSREDIESEVRRCVEVGKDRGGFILSTGCEISPKGDLDRVRTFCELAASMGRFE
ncbi:MAG: uroporphyrinogen decarboxylase family protein [bacterium]|jgi:uroporphyrinogen decarboxylase